MKIQNVESGKISQRLEKMFVKRFTPECLHMSTFIGFLEITIKATVLACKLKTKQQAEEQQGGGGVESQTAGGKQTRCSSERQSDRMTAC